MIGLLVAVALIVGLILLAAWLGSESGETKGKAGDSARIDSGPGIGGGLS